MFNIQALIKLIDASSDNTIQQSEMSDFLKTQDSAKPSIFTEYFNSIKSDISVYKFIDGINDVINQAYEKGQNPSLELNFKQQEVKKRYEQIIDEIFTRDELYRCYGCGFKSDEEFDSAFAELMSKYRDKGDDAFGLICDELNERTKYTNPIVIIERLSSGNFNYINKNFQHVEFGDVDLKPYADALKIFPFNEKTFAKVSSEHLPKSFNPQEIIINGKSIGLGIEKAHEKYKGDGVSFAVIDTGTLCEDGKYHSGVKFKEYYVPSSLKEDGKEIHGLATSYIAQEVAPNADCYYYANYNSDTLAENLQAIIDKNKTLPEDKKIRVISMSFSLDGDKEKVLPLVKELEAQGVWVFSSDEQFWERGFGYLEKKDSSGDIDDFNNYQIYAEADTDRKSKPEAIYVSSGNRTVPDPSNSDAYRHDTIASASWAIPVVAGYYTLACQADPSMTPDRFMELARSTARTVTSTYPKVENGIVVGREKETTEIKVIDINALLQAIEEKLK